MKRVIVILTILFSYVMEAQNLQPTPQISVNGEGKIKVTPDKVIVNFGIE